MSTRVLVAALAIAMSAWGMTSMIATASAQGAALPAQSDPGGAMTKTDAAKTKMKKDEKKSTKSMKTKKKM